MTLCSFIFSVTVCGTDYAISVDSTAFNFTHQVPLTYPGGTSICLWQVTAPPGQRVYAGNIKWRSQSDALLYFGPDPNMEEYYEYYSDPNVYYYAQMLRKLDVVSRPSVNTLWIGLEAHTPYGDDYLSVQLYATTNTGTNYTFLVFKGSFMIHVQPYRLIFLQNNLEIFTSVETFRNIMLLYKIFLINSFVWQNNCQIVFILST